MYWNCKDLKSLLQESEMVRETSQWEREEMEKVVSETKKKPLLFWEG